MLAGEMRLRRRLSYRLVKGLVSMERIMIDDMKRIELDLLDEIDRVCRAHGITYFIAYGTLLGAVRHGGFIPWDDDVDIAMLREDYELFMAGYAEWSGGDRFKLISYRDGESIFPFAKLTDTTTLVYENFIEKTRSNGVWVDIFPLDYVDRSDKRVFKRVFDKRAFLGLVRNFIVTDPSTGSSGFVRLAKKIVCPFAKRLDPVKYARKIDELAQFWRERPSGEVACIAGTEERDIIYPLKAFEPVEMAFEDRTYLAPAGYEDFLSVRYGDWRKLPPEDQREIHTFEAYKL